MMVDDHKPLLASKKQLPLWILRKSPEEISFVHTVPPAEKRYFGMGWLFTTVGVIIAGFTCVLFFLGISTASIRDMTRMPFEPKSIQEVAVIPPLCETNVSQFSGYFTLADGKLSSKSYFYMYFESKSIPEKDPVIFWLAGGPLCSGIIALINENGPCKLSGKTLKSNPYSWNEKANVIWIDQPAGVGYSFELNHDEHLRKTENLTQDLASFISTWVAQHPIFIDNPLYIMGDGVGGRYIPEIAWMLRDTIVFGDRRINLRGIAIGNGLVNPEIQTQSALEMATNNSHGIRLISPNQEKTMKLNLHQCSTYLKTCKLDSSQCDKAQDACLFNLYMPLIENGFNPYNIHQKCTLGLIDRCYDMTSFEEFLNTNAMHNVLHVHSHWANSPKGVCQSVNYDHLHHMLTHPIDGVVAKLLDKNYKVLIYAGDADYISNWMGLQKWASGLEWDGKEGFNSALDKVWQVDGIPCGAKRTFGALSFVRVYNAGHTVALDQPKASLEMINEFTS